MKRFICLVAVAGCVTDDVGEFEQAAVVGDACTGALRVPSASYSTIQSALDAAPAGATICLDPITFYESLTVTKSVTLRRRGLEGKPEIRPGRRASAVVDVGMDLTLTLVDIQLRGGDAGIRNPVVFSQGGARPIVRLYRVSILGAGVGGGVSGLMHLDANKLQVSNGLGDGIAIRGVADLKEVASSGNAGVGIQISDGAPLPAGFTRRLVDVTASGNDRAGIVIKNSAYAIDAAAIHGNTGLGLRLDNADGSTIDSSSITGTKQYSDSTFGVALQVDRSTNVALSTTQLEANAIAGLWIAGCTSAPSHVTLANNAFVSNPMHLVSSETEGCEVPPSDPVTDGGGNTCLDPDVCMLHSTTPTPPPPL